MEDRVTDDCPGPRGVRETFEHRVKLERLVAAVSTHFIHLGTDEVDEGINHALRTIGEFAGVDRSYVFLLSDDGATGSNTHEWCAEGIEPQIKFLQNLPASSFPWWMEKLRGRENIHIPRVADLPVEASAEKEILQAQGIQSLVVVPMLSGGRLIGFLGFDSVKMEKSWAEEDFALLEMLGNVLVNALERREAEKERRNLEEQFLQAQKMEAIGRLAGGIAHDFNNVLTVITGYSGLWLERLPPGDPLREDIEKIHVSAERAVSLTRQLLALSRQQIIQPRVIDLNIIITNLNRMLRRLIGEDIELITTLDADLGRVKADPGQIEQVIMNLVVNARDAMPQGGKLTIATAHVDAMETSARRHSDAPPKPYVMLAVSDTGCGMDADTAAHIFEPFFTTKDPGEGSGLGLSTVYGIVKQAGGHISVDSAPGRGTTFNIYLPRVEDEVRQIEKPESPLASFCGKETVLVVEDEALVRSLVRTVLQPYGYHVLEAKDAHEALLLCERHVGPVHLLLTDVVMPNMSGPELARRLAPKHPDMKVLYMSGYANQALTGDDASAEGVAWLQKPFTPEVLVRLVRNLLDAFHSGSSAPRVTENP